jgi:hypothetical protein
MGPPFRYVDASGHAWDVYDFKTVAGRKKRVPINCSDAEARAFVAVETGEVRIYKGYWSYHSTEPKILANELHFSKPLHSTAAERMAGG